MPQKYWKTAAVIIIALVVLVFTGRYLLKLGHEISIEVLKNVIQVETQGNYQIDFEEVTLNIRKRKLAISGLSLLPIIPKSEFDKTIYEVDIDSVVIHLESLSSIYLERELAIDSVRIIDPTLKLANPDTSTDSLNFSLQTGNLYQIISDQLAVLRIDKFHIENGDLSHAPSNFQLAGFDFQMDGLLMDSITHNDRVFFSTDIILEINDQVMLLPDSIHEVGFEKFLLSTTDSVLRFRNAFMRPSTLSGYSFLDDNDLNIYDIQVPDLALDGMDYFRAYNENVLSVEKVSIQSPTIRVDNEEARKGSTSDNNLLELLTDVFDSLEIKEFVLEDANVDLKLNSGGNDQRLSSNRSDIAIYGLLLDSTNAELDERNRYFDSASFTLLDYSYNLPDSIHQLNVRALTLNSSDSSIIVEDLRLAPDRNPNSSKTLAYLDVPYSSLTGVNFKEALLGDRLRMKDYFIAEPSLRVLPELKRNKQTNEKANFTPDDLFEILSIRYNTFYSRSLEVYNAQIQVEKQGIVRDVNFLLSQISLDQNTSLWTDMIDQMDIQTGKTQWQLDTLNVNAKGLEVSQKGTEVIINNLQVSDLADSLLFGSTQLVLTGHEPNRLVSGQFYTDTLKMIGPVLSLQADRSNRDNPSQAGRDKDLRIELPEQIGYLKIEDGLVRILRDSIDVIKTEGVNVWMSSDDNQPLDYLHTGIVSISFSDSPLGNVRIDEVGYERISRNLVLDRLSLAGSDGIELNADRIMISGIYQKGLFRDQYLLAGKCILQGLASNIDVKRLQNGRGNQNTSPNISFGQLIVENNKTVVQLDEKQTVQWEQGNLSIKEFSNVSGKLMTDNAFLFGKTGSISGDVDFYTGEQQLSLRDLFLDHSTKELTVDTLMFNNEKNIEAKVFELAIGGYSPTLLLEENQLKLDYILTNGSDINLRRGKEEVSMQVLSLPFRKLTIDSLKLAENQWRLSDQFTGTITSLNDLNLTSSQFSLDSLSDLNRWFGFSKTLSVSGSDFKQPLGEEYEVSVQDYSFDLTENEVTLSKVYLTPRLDRYSFSEKAETQKSWFDVDVNEIKVKSIDWESMARGRYQIDKVTVDQVAAEVYRDKNNPFPEGQYRVMPQKTLQDLDIPIWIDTIAITADIKYIERPKDSDQEGIMTFDEVEGIIYDFRTEDTLSDQQMVFVSKGKLFDSAPFNVKVNFDQNGPTYPFRMQGFVSDFDLVTLNQMLGPVAGVNIRSGYGEKIEFNFLADDKVASGDMRFRYDDLKIDILNKKTHEAHGLGRGIKTFFANTFVVKKKNSGFAFFVKKGQIFYERDTSRAIFNYWGKALISGAVSSIGINKSDKAAKRYQKSLAKSLKSD